MIPRVAAGPSPAGYDRINIYTRIIVDEALARGIRVEIVDPVMGELRLRCRDRTLTTIQSLSELTSAVAFRRCDDKPLTRAALAGAGLPIPIGRLATFDRADTDFLDAHGRIVVKPTRGEGGAGVTIGVSQPAALEAARRLARHHGPAVLLEQEVPGVDLRVLVIAGAVVAAAVRRCATVAGDGKSTIAELAGVTRPPGRWGRHHGGGGVCGMAPAATVPGVAAGDVLAASLAAGYDLDTVLGVGEELVVGRTANVHAGGTICDATADIHPQLAELAVAAAAAIDLPVAGVDLMVDAVDQPGAVIIEVNEQPGLANHEPHPTAARFLDLLFPETAGLSVRAAAPAFELTLLDP